MRVKALSLFILFILGFHFHAQNPIPTLTAPVIDQAHLLSPVEVGELSKQIHLLNKQGLIQAQILIVKSLSGETIEQFSIRLADQWKLGHKEKDNGAIFILAKDDRKVRIEVGSGLEGDLTDYQAHKIIQEILIPHFKNQQFFQGFSLALKKAQALVQKEGTPPLKSLAKLNPKPHFFAFIPFISFFMISLIFSFLGKGKKSSTGYSLLRGLFTSAAFSIPFLAMGIISPIIISILAIIGFIFGYLGFHQSGAMTSGGYHRRQGGGFSGGGSHWSGGGGGFSGGGASGDW